MSTWWLGILTASSILFVDFTIKPEIVSSDIEFFLSPEDDLGKAVMEILEIKCNVCHRKQNPFMVFKEKNLSKRAEKIYKMVFTERRMPKGDQVRLSTGEYSKLEKWLLTKIN